jgi:hypothetical protein
MDVNELPDILERKLSLDGRRKEFRCRLVEMTPSGAVVLFVAAGSYQVADLTLPPGTVTLGHFWTDRAYNVYHWLTPEGRTIAHYVNIAADIRIDQTEIAWRDLAVDLLWRPGGTKPEVLDEAELPADLDLGLRAHIGAATRAALAAAPAVVGELEARADALWPRLFGKARS